MRRLPLAHCLHSGTEAEKGNEMATQEVVEAQARPDTSRGKNEARRLRASGRIPATIYGAKKAAVAVSVDPKQISRILHSESGHNSIFDVKVGNENTKAM